MEISPNFVSSQDMGRRGRIVTKFTGVAVLATEKRTVRGTELGGEKDKNKVNFS